MGGLERSFWVKKPLPAATHGTTARPSALSAIAQRVLHDELAATDCKTAKQVRTVSAWGEEATAGLARLASAWSAPAEFGGLVGDTLARTGFEDITLIEFDRVKTHNLDRLSYANGMTWASPKWRFKLSIY